jgi:hypothetical protein
MNIFVLDQDPIACAKMHCDQHVRKMILEYTGALSYPYSTKEKCPVFGPLKFMNYPVCQWARKTVGNYAWLAELLEELGKEFEYRWGKKHSYDEKGYIDFFRTNKPNCVSGLEMTEFVMAMPDELKSENAIESYREYYLQYKVKFAQWTKRKEPIWYTEGLKELFEAGEGQ